MLSIEKHISPLIEQQFPAFYREEGELFIAFTKAYYEWLENNLQELVFETQTGFDVGNTITQGETTGVIIAKFDDRYIVQLSEFDAFRCNTFCNDLTPATSSSGAVTAILEERKYNALYYIRRLSEIRDIDNTLDSFILQFKKKYLPNIQFTTASNKELFIKNSLDFYRAKGTERAVDLFFKLIHGFEANIYYPGQDLFKPSDNDWVNVRYLELEPADTNINMVGQIVYGTLSGANAYAERLVRVKKEGRFINVLYLSNLNGNFQTGENAYTIDLENNVTAKIYGSLTSFEILVSDDGFEVGEDLFLEGGLGKRGRARVRAVRSAIGTVDFQLIDGGWGYTDSAVIRGSDRVIQVTDIVNANTDYFNLNETFQQFETVKQDLVKLSITDNTIEEGVNATAYTNAEHIVVEGPVVFANTTAIVINYDSANSEFFANVDYVVTESGNADVTEAIDVTGTGTVIATSSNSTITYTSTNDIQLSRGDLLYQTANINNVEMRIANGTVSETFVDFDPVTNTYINFTADIGTFRTDRPFYRDSDGEEFSITSISNTNFGIDDEVNTIYRDGNIYGEISGVTATVTGNFSFTTEASFVYTEFEEQFTIYDFYNTDAIDSVINTNAVIDTEGAYQNVITDVVEFSNVTIGSIRTIIETSPGSGYPVDPFFIIDEPSVSKLERYDYEIHYSDANRNFVVGETIVGRTSGAEGRIFYHDPQNRVLRATRISINENLSQESDFIYNELITGQDTNVTSRITDVFELRRKPRTGLNADILSEAFSGTGFVTQLEVIDSGFGYEDGEELNLRSYRDPTKEVSVKLRLGQQGIGQGYHLNRKSFLSSDKYIQDSDFYQEYSYEVLTSLPFETYKDTLIKVLHVAGTKPFGSYVSTTETPINITLESETEGFDIRKDDVFINENIFYQHVANTA